MDSPLDRIIQWGEQQPLVRAMILTSTRAIPEGTVPGAVMDEFSDYDVILVVTDVMAFFPDRGWLAPFGEVLAMYRDPIDSADGLPKFGAVVQFVGGLKIDFTLWPVEMLRRIAIVPELPDELDAGYRVLLDKDGLAVDLKPPSYRAYIPTLPDAERYRYEIENFFLTAIYYTKYIWRGDLMAARHVLETYMLQEHLRPMLEWLVQIDHGGGVKAGLYGRGMQRWLQPDLWALLEQVYTGPSWEESWQALDAIVALMRATATEVGKHLGFDYPQEIEKQALAYLDQIKTTPRKAS